MPTSHQVHLVIPCFRESGRIGPFLEELAGELAAMEEVTLQVVDDGSGSEEVARMQMILEPLRARHAFVEALLALPHNLGKGGTVYSGWEASGEVRWLMFVDADGSVPAREVARIIRLARAEDQEMRAYFASRVKMLGRKVERVWHREVMGQVFHRMVNLLLGLQAHDTQCGCKLVPRRAFLQARPTLSLKGFTFDLDLLLQLQAHGCEVVEVPVDWHEMPGGKIRLLRDSLCMLADVMEMRRGIRASSHKGTKE